MSQPNDDEGVFALTLGELREDALGNESGYSMFFSPVTGEMFLYARDGVAKELQELISARRLRLPKGAQA